MSTAFEQLKQKAAKQTTTATPAGGSAFDALKAKGTAVAPVSQETEQKDGIIKTIVKGTVKPVATMIARPIQAIAELGGVSPDAVDEATKKIAGDYVAPVPRNAKDVLKDVGRAAETVSLGVGGAAPKTAAKSVFGRAVETVAQKIATAPGAIPIVKEASAIKRPLAALVREGAGIGAKSGAIYGAGEAVEDTGNVFDAPMGAIKGAALGGAVGGGVPIVTRGASAALGRIRRPSEDLDTLVGRITQGGKKEIADSKKALQIIDTRGIKTYEDLKKVTDETIGKFAEKQDTLIGALGKVHKGADLATPIQVGDKTIKANYVKNAIGQLKQHYATTGDIANLTRIGQLEQKMNRVGLHTKEINNLAREHGTELASKAFSPVTGEPLSGVNKVAFENTRKGLKTTVRSVLPGDASKSLDENMSHLFTLKRTADKMEKAVQKLENKIKDRGILERMGRLVGRGVDMTTGGTLRGFMTSFLPSNIGNKVMNSVDIERELAKNLNKINRLTKTGTDQEILQFIDKIIKKAGSAAATAEKPKPKNVFGRKK